jgi:hypothetical protein
MLVGKGVNVAKRQQRSSGSTETRFFTIHG